MQGANQSPICGCGSDQFERVAVSKADGSSYVTEVIACMHCRAMFHRPQTAPSGPSPFDSDDWAAQYRKSVLKRQRE
jgi:hypothetical protein